MNIFLDTETTGLPKDRNLGFQHTNNWPRMVQVTWITDFGNISSETTIKNFIIKPDGFMIPDEATKIHGISTSDALAKGTSLDQVLIELRSDLEKANKIVAHNIDFDINVILSEFYRRGIKVNVDNKKKICTMKLSNKIINSDEKYLKLEELYKYLFSQDINNTHNSYYDTLNMRLCFYELELKASIVETKKSVEKRINLFSEKFKIEFINFWNSMDYYWKANFNNEMLSNGFKTGFSVIRDSDLRTSRSLKFEITDEFISEFISFSKSCKSFYLNYEIHDLLPLRMMKKIDQLFLGQYNGANYSSDPMHEELCNSRETFENINVLEKIEIRELYVGGFSFRFDLTVLGGSEILEALIMTDHGYIDNLSKIIEFPNLKYLKSSTSEVNVFSKIFNLWKLEGLSIRFRNQLEQLQSQNLNVQASRLKRLKLSGLQSTSYNFLQKFPLLENLDLYNCNFKETSILLFCPQLKHLILGGTKINNIIDITNLKNLEMLWINNTDVSNISGIEKLKNLSRILLQDSKVVNFEPLLRHETNYLMIEINEEQVSENQKNLLRSKFGSSLSLKIKHKKSKSWLDSIFG